MRNENPLAKLADTGHRGKRSATEMPNTGHHGQKSAVPIVRIKFGRNEHRKSQPAWMGSRLESERSSYRVIDKAKGDFI